MATGHRAVGAVLSVIVQYVNRESCGKSVIEYIVFCLFASYVCPNYLTEEVVKFERSPHSPLQTTWNSPSIDMRGTEPHSAVSPNSGILVKVFRRSRK